MGFFSPFGRPSVFSAGSLSIPTVQKTQVFCWFFKWRVVVGAWRCNTRSKRTWRFVNGFFILFGRPSVFHRPFFSASPRLHTILYWAFDWCPQGVPFSTATNASAWLLLPLTRVPSTSLARTISPPPLAIALQQPLLTIPRAHRSNFSPSLSR